ncbi:uncharacterized protein LOC34621235 [Cyclospora cayetanensis]|uniref:Uncharacterized protein LOC34621235 n=1 Tax=Cyclospora cayetanensis TaxID=88456 RepID=A0A6P6RWZ8_9EIME|nr:uncharacterized protein LOC34621235 [Cyclospora cayetanensis]
MTTGGDGASAAPAAESPEAPAELSLRPDAGPFLCPESVYYCELMQRSAAWILLFKGVRSAEQEALELGAAWMGAVIEQVGRQARLFATLRGTAAANYCDIKQALRFVCPSAYALLFAAAVDPVAPRPPKQLPLKTGGPAIVSSEDSWLVYDLMGQNSKEHDGPSPPDNGRQKLQHQRRPPHVPDYLPRYPPPHLYQRTETPWALDQDPQVADFKRKYRKLELQLQLPQLQLPEPLPQNTQAVMAEQQAKQQNAAVGYAPRRLRKAEPGIGDRPAQDLYLG